MNKTSMLVEWYKYHTKHYSDDSGLPASCIWIIVEKPDKLCSFASRPPIVVLYEMAKLFSFHSTSKLWTVRFIVSIILGLSECK